MEYVSFSNTPECFQRLRQFCDKALAGGDVSTTVSELLADVRKRGNRAVLDATERFDGIRLSADDMPVDPSEIRAAARELSASDRKAIRTAIRHVKAFHRKTVPKNWRGKNEQGAAVGESFYPIRRVGLYIPGGSVPLVSTVIMTVVLAKLARCPEIVVCTPPRPDGSISPGLLAALSLVGVEEAYKVGGVQAIAAMAYGTDTMAPVDKVFGPGNAFVIEAKRQVFGTVGVDLLPGPSELMVLADAGAKPRHLAADLLAQAEHGSGKEVLYLVTTSKALIPKVEQALERMLPEREHAENCRKVLRERCLAVVCGSHEQAAEVANFVAPEHLELQVADRQLEKLTRRITTAGAILQGYMTPTVLGDFTAGPSHTLPTGRAGRFSSGLQVTDFMRRSSVLRYNAKSLEHAAPVVETFARLEKLDAHGRSLTERLKR
ncbi:MAG: histidinol dehydrogenase [Opitutales bacterium]